MTAAGHTTLEEIRSLEFDRNLHARMAASFLAQGLTKQAKRHAQQYVRFEVDLGLAYEALTRPHST